MTVGCHKYCFTPFFIDIKAYLYKTLTTKYYRRITLTGVNELPSVWLLPPAGKGVITTPLLPNFPYRLLPKHCTAPVASTAQLKLVELLLPPPHDDSKPARKRYKNSIWRIHAFQKIDSVAL